MKFLKAILIIYSRKRAFLGYQGGIIFPEKEKNYLKN
jgi:hypothetical protein